MPKVESVVYSQGTAEDVEDGLVISPPFFGVVDGFSAPYSPQVAKIRFGGLSGGEMVRRITQATFCLAAGNLSLREIVSRVNQKIGEIQTAQGIPLSQADKLAGASFVFLKVTEEKTEVIQGGDCFIVWLDNSGKIAIIRNQAYGHVSRNLKIMAGLMEKHQGNRGAMWTEFCPILARFRKEDVNNPESDAGFACLNGQPILKECWQKTEIPTAELRLAILFTDGFVPYSETAPQTGLQQRFIEEYEKIGLAGILQKKRRNDFNPHITEEEATAIALRF